MVEKCKRLFNKNNIYYIESIIYICCIIVVVVANIFGPIWIRMIPILFILGVIGRIFFERPVLTTTFGFIVSLCIVYINGTTSLYSNLVTSLIFAIYILLGEIFGNEFKVLYNDLYKNRKKKNNKYIKDIIVSIFICIIVTVLHNYANSNIFLYSSCKNRLNKYLNDNYNFKDYIIISTVYNYSNQKNFNFKVYDKKNDDFYNFVVYVDRDLNIYDGIKEREVSRKLNEINNILKEIINGRYNDITFNIDDINDVYELNIIKKLDKINETDIFEFSKQIADCIDLIIDSNKLNKIENINISLISNKDLTESRISTIYMDGYIANKEQKIQESYLYILKALDIVYLD